MLFRSRIHDAFDAARIPHAFGGALALAWCTERARGTIDIDVNVFLSIDCLDEVIGALPRSVRVPDGARDELREHGQSRLWWDTTPIDVFLNTTLFHEQVSERARTETFANRAIPFLACSDLAVFKAFCNRTKDWADLEEMIAAGTVDLSFVVGVITRLLGPSDERVSRLLTLDR